MWLLFQSLAMIVVLFLFFWARVGSQSPGPETRPARALDAILQDYAYRAFVHPRTGVSYDGIVPINLTGIQISALRLRSGSLFTRGVSMYKQFRIPDGVIEQPYVERLVLVYQNLGNWSTTFYSLPGYMYLTPILGLLAYDASDLSAKKLPELDIQASNQAISIQFGQVKPVPNGSIAKCVFLDLDGHVNFTNVASGNRCLAFKHGHFSIVVKSTPLPSEVPCGGNDSRVWIIVGCVVGGCALLILLALLILWVWKYKKRKKMHKMERAAEAGEELHMTTIGSTKAPAAMVTRTQPTLEKDYVP